MHSLDTFYPFNCVDGWLVSLIYESRFQLKMGKDALLKNILESLYLYESLILLTCDQPFMMSNVKITWGIIKSTPCSFHTSQNSFFLNRTTVTSCVLASVCKQLIKSQLNDLSLDNKYLSSLLPTISNPILHLIYK